MKKNTGFGAVGVVLVMAVLGLVGFISWRLYEANKVSQTSTAVEKSTSEDSKNQTRDQYSGWKTYCDDAKGVCFKYPSDWTIAPSTQNEITSATFKSPSGGLVGSYVNYDTRDGAEVPYYVAAIEDLDAVNASYKVVGGFYTSSTPIFPRYKVVDASFTNNLTIGSQATMTNTARFTFKDKNTGHLEVYPVASDGFTVDQAKAWFASSDAKTALLIVKSLSIK